MRLYLVVEGATEERFVKDVLAPHFHGLGYHRCTPMQVRRGGGARGGGRSWQPWQRFVSHLLKEHRGSEVRVSTMLDLYGIPGDTPGLDLALSGEARAGQIEAALAAQIGDHRFVPYVQVHEFEALVFAASDEFRLLSADQKMVAAVVAEAARYPNPELINDGVETAPSKRLHRLFAGYDKVEHGADVTGLAGLTRLRARCPHFGAWISQLEAELR